MKVLHILVELKFSGAEIMYVDAAPIFQEKGCELTVMATANNLGEYAPFFENAGYKIIHWPLPPIKKIFSHLKFYRSFIKLLKKERYDVIHIHNLPYLLEMALCAWLINVKSVYTFHNVFPTSFYSYPYHRFMRWFVKYVFKCKLQTISDSVYDHELNFYHNKTTLIHNWYGSNRYFPAINNEKSIARESLGIDINSFVIISIGGCSTIKNHFDIIKALPHILKDSPNCLYLHLGKGETESDEKHLAEELGVSGNIRFCGNQKDVRQYLIASDAYLMTSKFEGISLTTIEAMACLIPTILYDVPGLRDFNKTGENSIKSPEDFKVLAEKTLYIKNNPQSSEEMAVRARKFINNTFDMKTNASKIFDLYN